MIIVVVIMTTTMMTIIVIRIMASFAVDGLSVGVAAAADNVIMMLIMTIHVITNLKVLAARFSTSGH
jgi:hypothetical protein